MKKSAIPKPTTGYRPSPLVADKKVLSFDEIYNWLRTQEGPPSYSAVKDGKKKDGTQLFSIGLGHQIQPNESNLMTALLNDEQVLEIFKKDIDSIISAMNKVIKVAINKNQQLALLSLRYNIGGPAFDGSTLLRELNSGNYTGAALRFAEWRLSEGKISPGLVARRERERQLFSKPV
jgi:lysozyme